MKVKYSSVFLIEFLGISHNSFNSSLVFGSFQEFLLLLRILNLYQESCVKFKTNPKLLGLLIIDLDI